MASEVVIAEVRSKLAILGSVVAAAGVMISFGWSIWIIRDSLLLWNYCPAVALDDSFQRVVWSCVGSILAVVGVLAIARLTDRTIAAAFSLALIITALVPLGVLYFFGSSALTPEIAASWLPCGVTDAVANARALSLALPSVSLGGASIALLAKQRGPRLLVPLVVGLAVSGGWIAFLVAVVVS